MLLIGTTITLVVASVLLILMMLSKRSAHVNRLGAVSDRWLADHMWTRSEDPVRCVPRARRGTGASVDHSRLTSRASLSSRRPMNLV